jgi:methylglutaconyl-CoA hydratase
MSNAPVTLTVSTITEDENYDDTVAVLAINRPDAANAFNADVMDQLIDKLNMIASNDTIRVLIIKGEGRHFSAGADLGWMKDSAKLSMDQNIADAKNLTNLFETLTNLRIPTIAVVSGAAYGGAVGLVAACDYAIATDTAKFCLSEVKLGLLPAVILPYLGRKISNGDLRRLSLSAKVFDSKEAEDIELVQIVTTTDNLYQTVIKEINNLLAAGPVAQRALKTLLDQVRESHFQQSDLTVNAIAEARTGDEGQAGLGAFFEKKSPPWQLKMKDDWKL